MGKIFFNVYKQIPVCNGYYINSDLNDVLQCGYYSSLLGYDNVDWFIDDMIKSEKRMNLFTTLRKITQWLKRTKNVFGKKRL